RAMLSKQAATNFSKTRLAPTIVKGLVPADGFGSTALVSQTKMLDAAGSNTFNYQFVDYYGMNTDQLVPWNSFLAGQLDVAGLTSALQDITDKVANDSSVKKLKITSPPPPPTHGRPPAAGPGRPPGGAGNRTGIG